VAARTGEETAGRVLTVRPRRGDCGAERISAPRRPIACVPVGEQRERLGVAQGEAANEFAGAGESAPVAVCARDATWLARKGATWAMEDGGDAPETSPPWFLTP
jgi:hypothetical protein